MAEPTKAELKEQLLAEQEKLAATEKITLEQKEIIASLERKLNLSEEELEQLQSVEGVVECINKLETKEKQLIAHLARTTKEGIAAYMTINFGAGGSKTIVEGAAVEATETPQLAAKKI